ncbi:bifunctional GNAT family N-acetyltransferase/carbon-nitrogen hydrolase family protein [Pelagicoccus sp. NFK12]|uniref:Bifunctional GNAT family N-acetyltransferase/carbon-nitrogen hydrolase family protein n=1 Tax=Pelagicoccus enzymogenes TaxID=2773457 RepID=A0A927FEK9_9BACT|nr:bifunctional GNAT family N-acetyltransferase/carbon-nitrogen hydrolase family protein [Pelagicoccus enzymogenes]MBD5782255.1 bifunctional GNAT family N-acetyltransferase/carbon-nitrogen hydrolase family protein [Pelagicoccus enzymogenes]MDQ8197849.1 bifunctional GNAT family N-acetyltransferase/carbon-nitrogen hydrolase family protein [Pelagicoccus enzymogenes]
MKPPKSSIVVRNWTMEDIPGIMDCHEAAYPDYSPEEVFDERLHELQMTAFPEGQFLAEADGKVVGYATSLIVQLDDLGEKHVYSYSEITGGYTFSTHEPSGDTLYGADIAVRPDYRGRRIASLLYEKRKELLSRYNLRRMVAYGRIPQYSEFAGRMTPEEFVEKVTAGELKDYALLAHLRAGYKVKRLLFDFMADESSMNYSTYLEMPNPTFDPARRMIAAAPLKRPVRSIRVCAAQWEMRRIHRWEEFEATVKFFVSTASSYHCHFLVLPELFTAQLFCLMPQDWEPKVAIRELAKMKDRYLELLKGLAKENGLYIVGGSIPVVNEDASLKNVGFLFGPDGQVDFQEKLHITPTDANEWGMTPGDCLKIFDTSMARVAIQLSYDVEFPEASRLLALAGAEVIFVPYSTDEKKAYNRVRFCAQARATENYVYVVMAGNVGNLPTYENYLINYGQAAVFTPSDFAFPVDAIAGEADPNAETVVICDLDLNTLAMQRDVGTVRPLGARREDLYRLRPQKRIKRVRFS